VAGYFSSHGFPIMTTEIALQAMELFIDARNVTPTAFPSLGGLNRVAKVSCGKILQE
jgi:hypothetical protein